jgi:hypothetical protein
MPPLPKSLSGIEPLHQHQQQKQQQQQQQIHSRKTESMIQMLQRKQSLTNNVHSTKTNDQRANTTLDNQLAILRREMVRLICLN